MERRSDSVLLPSNCFKPARIMYKVCQKSCRTSVIKSLFQNHASSFFFRIIHMGSNAPFQSFLPHSHPCWKDSSRIFCNSVVTAIAISSMSEKSLSTGTVMFFLARNSQIQGITEQARVVLPQLFRQAP